MYHSAPASWTARPLDRDGRAAPWPGMPASPGAPPAGHPSFSDRRRRTGRRNHLAGLMAEEEVARHYAARGAIILARRLRGPGGELDLVALLDGLIVFVEVKASKRPQPLDSLVTERQWRRLEAAANHYMMTEAGKTGEVLGCRFDLAVMVQGRPPQIIENARSFDTY